MQNVPGGQFNRLLQALAVFTLPFPLPALSLREREKRFGMGTGSLLEMGKTAQTFSPCFDRDLKVSVIKVIERSSLIFPARCCLVLSH